MQPSRTMSISIDRSPDDVYRFVHNPENLTRWATAFCLSVRRDGDRWIVNTPNGEVSIQFAGDNTLGVLDHVVTVSPDLEVYVPMRVVRNGEGSEVLFTVFRLPEMTDEQFAADAAIVQRDLNTLKLVLEAG